MEILGLHLDLYELFGTIFGIIAVWLTIKENKLCFPIGILNVALYAYLFAQSKLYADSILQVFYIGLLVYGWIKWNKKSNTNSELKVSTVDKGQWPTLIALTASGFAIIWFVISNFTDGHIPFWDSFTMSLSLLAQWMIAKKKVENWIIWIIADIIYVSMYIYKDLYLTAFLYFIFILLAIKGYFEWRNSLLKSEKNWESISPS